MNLSKNEGKAICKYRYKAFGTNIESDFVLPQLMCGEGEPEVIILKGRVPGEISGVIAEASFFQATNTELLFYVHGVGKYYVGHGKRIIVEPESEANEQLVTLYLLGSAMGALLFQRGVLPVHGSAVVVNNASVIITGDSGAGKSSLTLAFRKRGFLYLTDDVAALEQRTEGIYVQPAYPQQKLWKDCIETMGGTVNDLAQINEDKSKYFSPAVKGFCNSPVRLEAICELTPEECDDVRLQVINGVEKMNVLMKNIYRYQLTDFFGRREDYFRKCVDIANRVRVFRLVRPIGRFSVDRQVELLLSQLV